MSVEVHLFGGLRVTGEGAPPPVRGAIPEAILCRLALEPERLFGTDELVAALWPETSDSLVSSLRAHLSRLRSRGWGELLPGGRGGYRLAVPADAVDVIRFRRLLSDTGDSRPASLAAAEALWTAPPLARVSAFPFAPPVIAELERLRRSAALERAAAELDDGSAAAALAVLTPWLTDPEDSAVGLLQARALDAVGRTAEALAAIDERLAHLRRRGAVAPDALTSLRARIAASGTEPVIVSAPLRVTAATADPREAPDAGTGIIGRVLELDAVRRAREQSRLVTLTGPAGVGKTRLAAEVAQRVGHDDDVQWFADLTVIRTPERLLGAVADVLGCAPHLDAVASVLDGRRTLLVLDNAEHVLGATASLCAALLERCEGLSVLVTSRESMRMAGERVVVIEPLLGAALEDAVTLFLARAASSSGITSWTTAQRERVRRLCAALDGLPLAIELAAARLDVLSLEELAASLDSAREAGAAGDRHDSIDDAIAWSVGMIPASEQQTLAQLAHFSGAFALDAVAGICAIDDGDVRECTVALARRSLIVPAGAATGERRFRLLDTVRRYARSRFPLADSEGWESRHARWMADYASRTAPALRTASASAARASLRSSAADLHDATVRAIRWGERALALELVGSLAWFWYERGHASEALRLIDDALALPGERQPEWEARALYAASFMRAVGGDPLATVQTIQQFVEAAELAGDPAHTMIAHTLLASLSAVEGNLPACDDELATARAWRARVPDTDAWAIADHLYISGDALRIAGRPAQALDALEEAFRLAVSLGHTWTVAATCYITGKVLTEVGRPLDAVAILRTGAQHSLARNDRISALAALNGIAVALVTVGAHEDAAEVFGLVDALGPRFGFHPSASDGAYSEPFRARAAQALGSGWRAALARGAEGEIAAVLERAAGAARGPVRPGREGRPSIVAGGVAPVATD